MSSLDPETLISGYAVEGVRDWERNAKHTTRADAGHCLGQKHLANLEKEISGALQQSVSSGIPKFIPMPEIENGGHRKNGFLWPFFALANSKQGSQEITRFELLILYEGKQCLAFRLEPGHPNVSSHNYTHLQFSRKPFRKKSQFKVSLHSLAIAIRRSLCRVRIRFLCFSLWSWPSMDTQERFV